MFMWSGQGMNRISVGARVFAVIVVGVCIAASSPLSRFLWFSAHASARVSGSTGSLRRPRSSSAKHGSVSEICAGGSCVHPSLFAGEGDDDRQTMDVSASPGRISRSVSVIKPTAAANQSGRYRLSTSVTKLSPNVMESIERFVFFIGYPRSMHTLVGSILDAHPHVVISNEYNLLLNFAKQPDMTRRQIFQAIYARSQLDITYGKRYDPREPQPTAKVLPRDSYSYFIQGQWQGSFKGHIKVIGDKKGGSTSQFLAYTKYHRVLSSMLKRVGLPTRVIHVIRNPFDSISTIFLRKMGSRFSANNTTPVENNEKLEFYLVRYLRLVDANAKCHGRKDFPPILDIHARDLKKQPRAVLLQLCRFLEIECSDEYLSSCESIIHHSASRTRERVVWPQHLKDTVNRKIQEVAFLSGYSFDSE
eukprot:scpid70651/ scgid1137/ 